MALLSNSPQYKVAASYEELLYSAPDAVMNFASAEPDFLHPCYYEKNFIECNMNGFTHLNKIGAGMQQEMREFMMRKIGADVPPECFAYSLSTFRFFRAILNCLPQIYFDDRGLSDDSTIVLFPQGAYYLFNRIAGSVLRWEDCIATVPTDYENGYKLTAKNIEDWMEANKTRVEGQPLLLLLENPTVLGHIYTKEELQDIDSVCARHRIYIFTDEVYRETCFPEQNFVSLASQTKDLNRIISVLALSKGYGNLQYSLSFARINPSLNDLGQGYYGDDWRSTTLHHNFITGAIVNDHEETYIVDARKRYSERANLILEYIDALNKKLSEPIVIVHTPQAGFSIALDMTRAFTGRDTIEQYPDHRLHNKLIRDFMDHGLLLPSLHASGVSDRLCFRLVYGKNPEEDVAKAFDIIEQVIQKHGGKLK